MTYNISQNDIKITYDELHKTYRFFPFYFPDNLDYNALIC